MLPRCAWVSHLGENYEREKREYRPFHARIVGFELALRLKEEAGGTRLP